MNEMTMGYHNGYLL